MGYKLHAVLALDGVPRAPGGGYHGARPRACPPVCYRLIVRVRYGEIGVVKALVCGRWGCRALYRVAGFALVAVRVRAHEPYAVVHPRVQSKQLAGEPVYPHTQSGAARLLYPRRIKV